MTGSTPDGVIQYTGYGMVHKSVTEANRQKGIAEGDEYKYASLYSYDKLGRQILARDPFEMNGTEISYAESKTYYDNAGNVVKTMTKTNKTGANETWSATEYTYDWRGLLIRVRQVADFSFQDIYPEFCRTYVQSTPRSQYIQGMEGLSILKNVVVISALFLIL